MTERSGALQEDDLYMSYADIIAKYGNYILMPAIHFAQTTIKMCENVKKCKPRIVYSLIHASD